jgi:hypothetical protein
MLAEQLRYVKSNEDRRDMRAREESLNQVSALICKHLGWESV